MALNAMTLTIMLGISLMILITGQTLYSSNGYHWFVTTWPYTDRAWGLEFLICSVVGSLSLLFPIRAIRWISSTILGCGHATVAFGVYSENPIAFGVVAYGIVAMASFVVIIMTVIEDW